MANVYQRAFEEYLDEKGFHYSHLRDEVLKVGIGGLDNVDHIDFFVIFDKSDESNSVQIRCLLPGASFKSDAKMAQGLAAVNILNQRYRWAKFYIDDDRDLTVETDELVSENTSGSEIYELLGSMSAIIDKTYPVIMKILWG